MLVPCALAKQGNRQYIGYTLHANKSARQQSLQLLLCPGCSTGAKFKFIALQVQHFAAVLTACEVCRHWPGQKVVIQCYECQVMAFAHVWDRPWDLIAG